MTKIIKIDPVAPEADRIAIAARVIREGGTVAFPTETVYGLGADGFNKEACRRIFEIKGRPSDNPLILHIPDPSWLGRVADEPREDVLQFARKVWPGPITLALKRAAAVPDIVTAGLDTVAIRCPAHKIAISLVGHSGVPIAAPSANLSTKPSTTRFEHVVEDLDGKADLIIDGGDATFGVESTIINMVADPPVLLRPGAFSVEELERFIGKIIVPGDSNVASNSGGPPMAPGMKYRHYAPSKRIAMAGGMGILAEAAAISNGGGPQIAILCSKEAAAKIQKGAELPGVSFIILGSEGDLYQIAHNLFNAFRGLDSSPAKFGIVQQFEEKGIGLAIMNRMAKATGNLLITDSAELNAFMAG
ncbi:MAG: L-threonylcarbamoyladenylate synthase [Candidatus Marsarchaeota archaeon]|nr:L-threonylcarbamoyladenylate synthase [Candidatus Marsarchaeota archaeon]